MKYLITALSLVFAVTTSSCQESVNKKMIANSDAPKVVVLAFQKKYPKESDPDFQTDSHGYWEAHFKKKGEKYRADFHADGRWIETENSIKVSELPQVIQDKINTTYAFYEISEVEHVMSASKGEFYDVEFKQKGKNKDIEFRKDGTVIE